VFLSRRQVLFFTAGTLVAPYIATKAWTAHHGGVETHLGRAVLAALEDSPYVYVSPLRSDGEESRCHGEVWYGWYEGSVFMTCETKTWKVRSVQSGLNSARLWVGDYGRWKGALGKNTSFTAGPKFDAKVSISDDEKNLSQLFKELARKYPKGWRRWEDRMKKAHKEGSRVLLRYTPVHA
tara:strand:- start:1200 stop:1739 length:540 start_codon:yes stop_codon:yes gene_type:complete